MTERWCAEYDKQGGIRLSCGGGELIANSSHTRKDVQLWLDMAADGTDWTKRYQAALDLIDGKRCAHRDEHTPIHLDYVERVGYSYGQDGKCSWFVAGKTDDTPKQYATLTGARHNRDGLRRMTNEALAVELQIAARITDPEVLRKLAAVLLSAARTIDRISE